MSEQCCLCEGRSEKDSEFCNLHRTASVNLETAYALWSKAFGGLGREEYYARLKSLREVGSAVKEILQYVQEKRTGPVRN
jgi:hypothetical protein